jgi:dTDP-4-amino-4,6-dideoxygalactose transaminase
MMDWRVPLADLDYGELEYQAVKNVLDSRWLTMGSVTEKFEQKFSDFVNARYAVAVSNATVGLHLACKVIDLGPGDEVIVPSLTFVATANAVRYTGAEVRFADIISENELTISPKEVERLITPRTKAIIPMHYAGFPCHMNELGEIALEHNLYIIEDSAHSPGSILHGKSLGCWGDVGCFSFFSNKNLSTGEGGMVVTNDQKIFEKVRLMRSHGMTSLTWDRHQGHAFSYDVVELGYNYRIDEIRSALGIVQLEKLNENNNKREKIARKYWKELRESGLVFPFRDLAEQDHVKSAFHIFSVLLPDGCDRNVFMEELRDLGIQTSIHYPPVHLFSYYQKLYPGVTLSITENVAKREVTLPLYPNMSEDQISIVIDGIKNALNNC